MLKKIKRPVYKTSEQPKKLKVKNPKKYYRNLIPHKTVKCCFNV